MLIGALKTAEFFEDHQNAIFGGIKGIATGGAIGASRDLGQHRTIGTRLKKIRDGALLGALIGTGFGHGLDSNKEEIGNFINEQVAHIDQLVN